MYCYSTTNPEAPAQTEAGQPAAPVKIVRRSFKGTKRFLVTAAQNATPAHEGFLKSLETACNHLNAELLVIPIRYKNPTSRWMASQANAEEWDLPLRPYLFNTRRKLNPHIVVLGDVKTQPTASSPLTGFDALTHGESAILGHTKLQLRTVATPQNKLPKILTTTGAVTVPNYTDSKAGALGNFHHTLGAALVEVSGKTFHLRQINADKKTGEFYDLDLRFGPMGATSGWNARGLVMGDTHVDFIDARVERATFEKDGIADVMFPDVLVWHDLLDGYAVNPHHNGNVFIEIAKRQTGRDEVLKEVRRALDFIQKWTRDDQLSVIVPSNHNDFLTRWVLNTDWRSAPVNARFYLETALAMVESTRMTEGGTEYASPFAHWGRERLPLGQFRFLNRDESFVVEGVEVGLHGDRGPNGARGSARNLRRVGVRSIIGHSHSPAIEEGCYQVGTSTRLKLEYNSGPSGWLNTHCLIYPNGKRSLINIIGGQWRLHD